MSDISDAYRRLAEQFESKVIAVPSDAWGNPSPCPGWDARDVVRHIVESSNHFLGWVDRAPTDVPSVDEDPVAAWRATRRAVEDVLDDDAVAGRVLERPGGTAPLESFVDRFLSFDLVIHAWDLARAAGIDDRLDLDSVRRARSQADEIVEMGRAMGAFGPPVPVPDSADEQTKLLAVVGRTY